MGRKMEEKCVWGMSMGWSVGKVDIERIVETMHNGILLMEGRKFEEKVKNILIV